MFRILMKNSDAIKKIAAVHLSKRMKVKTMVYERYCLTSIHELELWPYALLASNRTEGFIIEKTLNRNFESSIGWLYKIKNQ